MPSSGNSSTTLTNPEPLNPVTPLQSKRHSFFKVSPSTPKYIFPWGPRKTGDEDLDCYMHGLSGLPPEWKQYIHVDGKPYFRNTKLGIVTEANIRHAPTLMALDAWYTRVNNVRLGPTPNKPKFVLSEHLELYLALHPKPGYYYVDHQLQSVFWLEDLPLHKLGLDKIRASHSFKLFIERNYYRHLENFPVHTNLPPDAEERLREALVQACTEHMTSRDSSTYPWNADDCQKFLGLLDSLNFKDASESTGKGIGEKGTGQAGKEKGVGQADKEIEPRGYKTWFVSRLFCNILHNRLLYKYGMNEAITDRLSLLEQQRSKRFGRLGDILSMLFFSAPYTYFDRLEKLWADRIVSLDGWQKLLVSLLTEWSDSNLLATVTLSANMALLALADINQIARTTSISSSLFALGSIVVGLHHVWRHRVKIDTNADQAGIYLRNATSSVSSLEYLAFFLSLPLVLLLWSLLLFAIAVSSYAFYWGREQWSYSLIGVVLSIVFGLVVLTLTFFWGMFEQR